MTKVDWEEAHKRQQVSQWKIPISFRRFVNYVLFGTIDSSRIKKRVMRIFEEEFYADDFNSETLEELYTAVIAVIENMKHFSAFWKNEMNVKEKEIRKFASAFCFGGDMDVFDKMTEYLERITSSVMKVYTSRKVILIVNVKFPVHLKAKLHVCVQLKSNNKMKSFKYTDNKTNDACGETMFFELGKNVSKHVIIAHFYDETEVSDVQWFSTAYNVRKVLISEQTPLSFDVSKVQYLMIGEKSFDYQTQVKGKSTTKRYATHSRSFSLVSAELVETKMTENQYVFKVSSNVETRKLQAIKDGERKKKRTAPNIYLSTHRIIEQNVGQRQTNYDVPVIFSFFLGITSNKRQKLKDLRIHTLLYRLMLIKKAKCPTLFDNDSKVYQIKQLFWNDLCVAEEDQLFKMVMKNHCIQNNITAGEDYACRCMAVFASVKYRNITFDPSFVADCLKPLNQHKEQFEFFPVPATIALNTAYTGILFYIINNYLRNINFILDKLVKEMTKTQPEDDKPDDEKAPLQDKEEAVRKTMLRLRQFSQKRKMLVNLNESFVNEQILQSLVCIHSLNQLSSRSNEVRATFEKHLQQNLIRWFKEFMNSQTKPQISEFLDTFLDQLTVGDFYFKKVGLYAKYSYILTKPIIVIVGEAKRVIDSYTKLIDSKTSVYFDSDYITKLFLHLMSLANFIENGYTKLEAADLHSVKNEIKEYLPSTIAALFKKDTANLIESVLHEENFAPIDVSQNILFCHSVNNFMEKIVEMISLGLEELRLPPHLIVDELTKAIIKQSTIYSENVWKRFEQEKFFINPLKQGVGSEAFVVINTFKSLALFVKSDRCVIKFSKALVQPKKAKSIATQYEVLSNKMQFLAKKAWSRIVEIIMGMLSQVLLYIYSGLESNGYKFNTLTNIASMLMFQTKHKIQNVQLMDEMLIDMWTEFLLVYERLLGSFEHKNKYLVKEGVIRLKAALKYTESTLTKVVGVSTDVINHKNSYGSLTQRLDALIVKA